MLMFDNFVFVATEINHNSQFHTLEFGTIGLTYLNTIKLLTLKQVGKNIYEAECTVRVISELFLGDSGNIYKGSL